MAQLMVSAIHDIHAVRFFYSFFRPLSAQEWFYAVPPVTRSYVAGAILVTASCSVSVFLLQEVVALHILSVIIVLSCLFVPVGPGVPIFFVLQHQPGLLEATDLAAFHKFLLLRGAKRRLSLPHVFPGTLLPTPRGGLLSRSDERLCSHAPLWRWPHVLCLRIRQRPSILGVLARVHDGVRLGSPQRRRPNVISWPLQLSVGSSRPNPFAPVPMRLPLTGMLVLLRALWQGSIPPVGATRIQHAARQFTGGGPGGNCCRPSVLFLRRRLSLHTCRPRAAPFAYACLAPTALRTQRWCEPGRAEGSGSRAWACGAGRAAAPTPCQPAAHRRAATSRGPS